MYKTGNSIRRNSTALRGYDRYPKPESVDVHDSMEITTLQEGRKVINKLLLCQIIESRMSELFQYINKKIVLDFGSDFTMVIGGGGSLLKGLHPFLKERYFMDVREGFPDNIKPIIESSAYATAVGLVLFGVKARSVQFNKVIKNKFRLKTWVQNFF